VGGRSGTFGGGGGGGSWTTGQHGEIQDGYYTSTRRESGATVIEVHYFVRGSEITITQSFRLSEEGKTLTVSEEAIHEQQRYRNTLDFELPQ
jgi:hypothetical protein